MQRVSVVGNAGSGNSRLARRIAERLNLAYVELDAIHHLANWNPNSSIIRWSRTQHAKYSKRFDSAMRSSELAYLTFVRLTSHADADSWVAEL